MRFFRGTKKQKKIIFLVLFLFVLAAVPSILAGVFYAIGLNGWGPFCPIQPGAFYDKVPYEEFIDFTVKPENTFCRIADYGASPGKSPKENAAAINRAIADCSNAGGGTVVVSGGEYPSATVYLKSNAAVFIEANSALTASHTFGDFDGAFIKAENAENIKLYGAGKIKGEGEYFLLPPKKPHNSAPLGISDIRVLKSEYWDRIRFGKAGRPEAMVHFLNCRDIHVSDIVLENAMNWTLKLEKCSNAEVKNTVINNNRHAANTDGIDIAASQNVTVKKVFISTADDGIVLKNWEKDSRYAVRDIFVSDCKIMTCTNAFKIGSETAGEISGVTVENCIAFTDGIFPGSVSGISIESMDGARVHDIQIRNFEMLNVTCPLFIRLGNRNRYWGQSYQGAIENITIENVTAVNAELPMLLTGVKKSGKTALCLKNITLRNFDITYLESESNVVLRKSVPEYKKKYPENWDFKDVPAYGLWGRHIEGLSLEYVYVTPRLAERRECFAFENAGNSTVVESGNGLTHP